MLLLTNAQASMRRRKYLRIAKKRLAAKDAPVASANGAAPAKPRQRLQGPLARKPQIREIVAKIKAKVNSWRTFDNALGVAVGLFCTFFDWISGEALHVVPTFAGYFLLWKMLVHHWARQHVRSFFAGGASMTLLAAGAGFGPVGVAEAAAMILIGGVFTTVLMFLVEALIWVFTLLFEGVVNTVAISP